MLNFVLVSVLLTTDAILLVNPAPPSVKAIATIHAPDVSEGLFGYAVAVDGSCVAIASGNSEDGTAETGVLRLYDLENSTPANVGALRAPARKWPDGFAAAMSIDTSSLFVGAPLDAQFGWDTGAAWMYERSNGSKFQLLGRITPPEPQPGAKFGDAVAIDGNVAIVGAPREDTHAMDAGVVHLFERRSNVWQWVTAIKAPDGAEADFFGASVALAGEWAAVGAWADDDHGEKTGAVWLYRITKEGAEVWGKLVPKSVKERDRFGWAVQFCGGDLLVSSCGANNTQGEVHCFRQDRGAWQQTHTLFDPDGSAGDFFGYALAAQGTIAVVGSPGANSLDGKATVYRHWQNEWRHLESLEVIAEHSDGEAQPLAFGWSVATDGTRILIGRINDVDAQPEPGRAWLYEVIPNLHGATAEADD